MSETDTDIDDFQKFESMESYFKISNISINFEELNKFIKRIFAHAKKQGIYYPFKNPNDLSTFGPLNKTIITKYSDEENIINEYIPVEKDINDCFVYDPNQSNVDNYIENEIRSNKNEPKLDMLESILVGSVDISSCCNYIPENNFECLG